jgi:hypothetical protein
MIHAGIFLISFIYFNCKFISSIIDETDCLQSAYGCYLNTANHCRSYSTQVIYVDSSYEGMTNNGEKTTPYKVFMFIFLNNFNRI